MMRNALFGLLFLTILFADIAHTQAQIPAYLAPVKQGNRWGYVDTSGKMILDARYDEAFGFSSDLALVKIGARWGYIDNKGNIKINPVLEMAHNFNNGRALAEIIDPADGERYFTYIDTRKDIKYILALSETGYDYSDGLARVRSTDSSGFVFGYMDTTGNWGIYPSYKYALDFNEGLAAVSNDGKWGFIDRNDRMQIQPQFTNVFSFYEGLAYAEKINEKGFIDTKGKWAIKMNPKYGTPGYVFSEGLVPVIYEGKLGYMDTKGKLEIKHEYDNSYGHPFKEGLAAAAVKNDDGSLKWGFINTKGKWVVKPDYEEAGDFFKGHAWVKKNGKYGFINSKGKWAIEPVYDGAYSFTPAF